MIELVNGNEVVKVPEEMTIEIYQKLIKDQEKYFNQPIEMIALFTNLPINKLKNLSPKTIEMINNFVSTKVSVPKMDELVLTFIHNGVEYGLETNIGGMAWGAWVDLEVYSSENITDNIHKIMSILYRPIVSKKNPKKYTIEPYDSDTVGERAKEFLTLPINFWLQVSDFFLGVVNLYITNIKASLELKNKMNKYKMKGMRILPKWVQKKLLRGSILS